MKLTEKELNEFPIGTKIIYQGNEVIKIELTQNKHNNIWYNVNTYDMYDTEQLLIVARHESTEGCIEKIEIPTYTEYIPPKPILDDKEKEYLSYVIRPFKNKVKYIRKTPDRTKYEYIRIVYNDGDLPTDLKDFDKGTMYKGMKLYKEYLLEELRLIVDENIQM